MPNELHLTPQVVKDILEKPEAELSQIQQALAKAIKAGRSNSEVLAIWENAMMDETSSESQNRTITIRLRL